MTILKKELEIKENLKIISEIQTKLGKKHKSKYTINNALREIEDRGAPRWLIWLSFYLQLRS